MLRGAAFLTIISLFIFDKIVKYWQKTVKIPLKYLIKVNYPMRNMKL